MKKIVIIVSTLFLLLVSPVFINNTFADAPPDPGGDPNTGGGTPVGGAPVGGGLIAMALYGALYGILKMRAFIKNHA